MNTSAMPQANTKICKKHNVEMKVEVIECLDPLKNMTFYYCDICGTERELEEKNKKIEEEKNQEFNRLNRGIPRKFLGARLEHFNNISPILNWIKNPNGFLFIHGECGCGKSHLSAAIKYHFNSVDIQCGLAFCSDIFLKLRNSFNSSGGENEFDIIKIYAPDETKLDDFYNSVPYKHNGIFDDIGAQKISDYVIEAWYNIIDRRYMFEHPTVFTSNLSLKEISLCMTDRIASRLASGIVFELKGNDRRLMKTESKQCK